MYVPGHSLCFPHCTPLSSCDSFSSVELPLQVSFSVAMSHLKTWNFLTCLQPWGPKNSSENVLSCQPTSLAHLSLEQGLVSPVVMGQLGLKEDLYFFCAFTYLKNKQKMGMFVLSEQSSSLCQRTELRFYWWASWGFVMHLKHIVVMWTLSAWHIPTPRISEGSWSQHKPQSSHKQHRHSSHSDKIREPSLNPTFVARHSPTAQAGLYRDSSSQLAGLIFSAHCWTCIRDQPRAGQRDPGRTQDSAAV